MVIIHNILNFIWIFYYLILIVNFFKCSVYILNLKPWWSWFHPPYTVRHFSLSYFVTSLVTRYVIGPDIVNDKMRWCMQVFIGFLYRYNRFRIACCLYNLCYPFKFAPLAMTYDFLLLLSWDTLGKYYNIILYYYDLWSRIRNINAWIVVSWWSYTLKWRWNYLNYIE